MRTGVAKARIAKQDEFYTDFDVIQEELERYKPLFEDKVVYCNCDNPVTSDFWLFFSKVFLSWKLKKLIATYIGLSEKWIIECTHGRWMSLYAEPLCCAGDFRSEPCVKLLQEADIVVTNPPFSLFREYMALLVQYQKQFIVLGHMNAVTYKEVFPLLKSDQVWLGASIHAGDRRFYVPDDYPLNAAGCGIDDDGRRFIHVKGVRWFTNLDYPDRHNHPLELTCTYQGHELDYPQYDTYDAINVDRVCDIPKDYDGVMGVPITFMDKYCPEQFEILGCSANPECNELVRRPRSAQVAALIKDGRLRGAKCVGGNSNLILEPDGYVRVLYHRLFIRKRRNPSVL